MSKYLNQVMGAKRRIELRERPEPDPREAPLTEETPAGEPQQSPA